MAESMLGCIAIKVKYLYLAWHCRRHRVVIRAVICPPAAMILVSWGGIQMVIAMEEVLVFSLTYLHMSVNKEDLRYASFQVSNCAPCLQHR